MATVTTIKQKGSQFWDIKKAGERLLWRFQKDANGNFKSFVPNDNDVAALKCVLAWVNRNTSENVKNNQLFAKLYIYFLTQGIRYHETTVLENEVQKELSKILDKPLQLFYKAFANDLYSNQLSRLMTEETPEDAKQVLSDLKKFQETYSEDLIESKLDEMISEALNRFS